MKNFFKDNTYLIIKFVVYQLGIMVMGITSSLAVVKIRWLYPIASLFCVVFYLFLIYLAGYEVGQKDGIKLEAGKIKKDPLRLFWVGLIANSLNLLLGLVIVIVRLAMNMPFSGEIVGSFGAEWLVSLQEILLLVARIIQMMYLGMIEVWFGGNVVLMVLIPIPAILTAGVSYLLGIKYKNGFLPKKEKNSDTKRYS